MKHEPQRLVWDLTVQVLVFEERENQTKAGENNSFFIRKQSFCLHDHQDSSELTEDVLSEFLVVMPGVVSCQVF